MPSVGAIVADRLVKHYGRRIAVRGVSFSIQQGEVVGLLGPNGSGKSTVIRILTGYLPRSGGAAWIQGLDVAEEPLAIRRNIGYVPEDAPIYDNMRVDEFLRFMAEIKGVSGKAARRAVGSACERLALAPVFKVGIGKLSRGYRQRVAIAQALLSDPPILVFDEPTNALDAYQVIAIRELIRSFAGERTVLVASHVLTEIEKIATRVMILLDGTLLTADALAETRHAPSFRLRIAGPRPGVVAALGKVRGVLSADVDASASANTYVVATDSGPEIAADLVRAVVDQGFALTELSDVKPDLERVFLDLTQRTVEARAT
jgi:ABC-2 type transport system ATP-binding protein